MQRSLFLYLFLLAALLNVFTYSYFKGQVKFSEERTAKKIERVRDSSLIYYNQWMDLAQFSLDGNTHAQDYFYPIDYREIQEQVPAFIIGLNDAPEGNRLIPYDKINENKFIINKVQLLNHRWAIANFSDGKVWGDLLLKYFVTQEGEITVERMDAQLFAK